MCQTPRTALYNTRDHATRAARQLHVMVGRQRRLYGFDETSETALSPQQKVVGMAAASAWPPRRRRVGMAAGGSAWPPAGRHGRRRVGMAGGLASDRLRVGMCIGICMDICMTIMCRQMWQMCRHVYRSMCTIDMRVDTCACMCTGMQIVMCIQISVRGARGVGVPGIVIQGRVP